MSERSYCFVYIGRWDMYRNKAGNGFGIFKYDLDSGELYPVGAAFPQVTVGAACLDDERNILYCTHESTTLPGNFLGGGGQVYALAINSETGQLTEINHLPSYGSLPCHLSVDAASRYLIVTHHTDRVPVTKVERHSSGRYGMRLEYDDATTVLFPLREDGVIGEPVDVFMHSGDGGPLPKQTHPQLHSVFRSPSGELFAVCDKGNDEIVFFRINRQAQKLEVFGGGFKTVPGSSPRYSVFHPTRPYFFTNHETKAVISAFRYDGCGHLESICTISALPEDCPDDPEMKQSDIKIHPSGKYLYSLLRGISAISVFAVNDDTGEIARIQTVKLEGTGPRGCAISPDGRFMLIAAFTSNEVLIWSIDAEGKLAATGRKISEPNPGSVTFFSPASPS